MARTKKEPRSKIAPILFEQHFEIIGLRMTVKSLRFGILMILIIGLLFLAMLQSTAKEEINSLREQVAVLEESHVCDNSTRFFRSKQDAINYNDCIDQWSNANRVPIIYDIKTD